MSARALLLAPLLAAVTLPRLLANPPNGARIVSGELAVSTSRSGTRSLVRTGPWPFVVWTAMAGWSLALVTIVRSDYLEFRLARFDLGNMVQAVWSTSHGRPLEMTDATGQQIIRLGSHVDPILVLFAPLWIVAPTPLTLATVQVVACALGALPVFWLARRHLESERAAALMALVYLTYPWLAWTAIDAVHPVTLAIPLVLFAIWFLDTGRFLLFAGCAVLVLATGELMGLSLAGLGLWYWLARGQRWVGLVIVGVGIAWTVVCLTAIVPGFRGDESPFYDRYASVGGSPVGVVRTAITDPGAVVSALSTSEDLLYLAYLTAPLAGASLLAPALSAVALPQLLVNGLADWSTTTDPRHHYVAGVLPFLFAGAVLGLTRVPPAGRTRVTAVILLVCVACALVVGPWPRAVGAKPVGLDGTLPRTHVRALRMAILHVPENSPVAATNHIGSRLSARRHFYSVPTVGGAKWILLDTWDTWMPKSEARAEGRHPEVLRTFLNRIRASPRWRQEFGRDGVFVFERR